MFPLKLKRINLLFHNFKNKTSLSFEEKNL